MIRKLEKLFEGNWDEIKGKLKRNWGKLSNDDIKQIDGSYDIFVGKVKKAYGYGIDEIEEGLNDFFSSIDLDQVGKKLKSIKDDATDKAFSLKESIQNSLQDCAQNFLERSLNIEENVVEYVKNNPMKVIGIAAVTSYVISKLLESKN